MNKREFLGENIIFFHSLSLGGSEGKNVRDESWKTDKSGEIK